MLDHWIAMRPDERNWALDAMEFDREQLEADEEEHANRLAPLPGEVGAPSWDCPDCGSYECCC